MNNALLIFVLIAGPLVAYVVVLLLPRWFARSLHRHRMWRLRDTVVDDVLAGTLPRDHTAVKQLVFGMDAMLRRKQIITFLDVYTMKWASKGIDPGLREASQAKGFHCSLDGLSRDEQERIEAYRAQFMTLLVGSVLLGSWFGIAHIVRFVPAGVAAGMHQASVATRDGIRHRLEDIKSRFEREILVSARTATDLAANKSHIWQDVAVLATRHDGVSTHEHPLMTSRH
jgi:hypothetical protein